MNKNINNHNGKEIHRDQIQNNVSKEGDTNPDGRIRKKSTGREKEIHPVEPKNPPVNINKSSNNPNKSAPKSKVIKLGNKEKGIHPVETSVIKNISSTVDPIQTRTPNKSVTTQARVTKAPFTQVESQEVKKESVKHSAHPGKFLYVIAAVLFIGWAIGFFYYNLDANIHILLGLAVIVGIISYLQERKK